MQNKTQIWTLIGAVVGAVIGFFLSFLAMGILNKRNYEKLLQSGKFVINIKKKRDSYL